MSDPDIDPYAILGVAKEATLPDIKSAHRKLVLKCHPDKIQDQSLRAKAQDEFQKVQQAYELLSDDARRLKYDQKVRLMELRREMLARGGSAAAAARGGSATSREFRNGHIYEERTPGESFFFEDEVRFTEEPQSTSRKNDEYGRRHRTARPPPEERRRSKPTPAARVPRETTARDNTARDTTRAHYENRDKHRTKERRREAFAKSHERSAPYVDSDGGGDSDDSNVSFVYVRLSRPSSDRRKSKSKPRTSHRSEPRYSRDDVDVEDDDDAEDDSEARAESKHDMLHNTAKNYIRRTKSSPPIEVEPPAPRRHRHHRSSHSPPHGRRDESTPDPDSSTRRTREPTPKRPSRESVRHQGSSRSRHGSYEHLEPRAARSYETVPPMPTATSARPQHDPHPPAPPP
ncbi:DnaJ-domain-containing protein [Aspergillus campestris IBT 28561]|uniref:DnaJ-domain-containing protein n=1 Tax=Aspergillus campestris (strain IBT 28561) TaxID=1392248 RepID=A0A2I1D2W1_ASPC2|nr:DnaJ-domain-containing protein [Aspergillus campestris IBT 28561]PKY04210.1 DnaJ-domain-containing protein [Aspergillus campestris IBT 28561]